MPKQWTITAIALVLLLLTALLTMTTEGVSAAPVPPAVRIVVRTEAGQPVAGVQVTLRAASSQLGGPLTPVPEQAAATGADGSVSFPTLGDWVWYARFSGVLAGKPLQPPTDQGRPPWDTNPAGGGLPLLVESPLELVPQANTGSDTGPVLVGIVLIEDPTMWIPAADVAAAGEQPFPLALMLAQTTRTRSGSRVTGPVGSDLSRPRTTATPAADATRADSAMGIAPPATTAAKPQADLPAWLIVGGLAIGGLYLLIARVTRRTRRTQR